MTPDENPDTEAREDEARAEAEAQDATAQGEADAQAASHPDTAAEQESADDAAVADAEVDALPADEAATLDTENPEPATADIVDAVDHPASGIVGEATAPADAPNVDALPDIDPEGRAKALAIVANAVAVGLYGDLGRGQVPDADGRPQPEMSPSEASRVTRVANHVIDAVVREGDAF